MQYRCLQTWAPIRKEASSASEMVTSLLFGETCTVTSILDDWLQVQCDLDRYEGWIPSYYLFPVMGKEQDWTKMVLNIGATLEGETGKIQLSPGSNLPTGNEIAIGNSSFIIKNVTHKNAPDIMETAKMFTHLPYLWGGRSIAGLDCSGLTQVVMKMHKITLPRDAYQQAEHGEDIQFGRHIAGDLAFFGKKEKITHVGILLNEGEIIHAHGKVRIDRFTAEGIFNADYQKISHRLAAIKRLLN